MKRIIIALSLYSRIPMPQFRWDEKDTEHAVAYLPLVGLIIAGIEYISYWILNYIEANDIAKIAVFSVIPLMVTGGFHMDGFMDVEDALKSYKSKEEKLLIMKDPNIGAFAIIRLLIYSLIWIIAMSFIIDMKMSMFLIFISLFFEARAQAGFISLIVPHAKKNGMLNMETSEHKGDKVFLVFQMLLGLAVMIYLNAFIALLIAIASIAYFFIYKHRMITNFGGITGDTIGYYIVTWMELMVVVEVIGSFIGL